MAITSKTVEEINQAAQRLPLKPVRVAELPVELGQFADVMARVRGRLTFDQDPSELLRGLRAAGAKAPR
ncbi:MAG: hypothetical protein JO021_19705 [Alphaproteobacteria bacterium]|nr:hypothetical protein [Alphaproteobacteria bacterium]